MDEVLDVHVGTPSPGEWDRIDKQQVNYPTDSPARRKRPRIVAEDLRWDQVGLRPRWGGDDTTRAVAAIDPCTFYQRGADELERFFLGVHKRGELALSVWSFGDLEPAGPSGVRHLFGDDASVRFPKIDSFWISGTRIRLADRPSMAAGLAGADRDLALRLGQRSLDLPWWSLRPTCRQPGGYFGSWTPLLTTPAGEVVAGVWTEHEDGDAQAALVRHYVIPAPASYGPILQWLAERGIPEFVPGATRRSHRYVADLPEMQTTQERTLVENLERLGQDYREKQEQLRAGLAAQRARADEVREPLLFGAGTELEHAVAQVLTEAGLHVTRLDPLLGTKSADLLVECVGRRVLVEVKSSSGPASEQLVDTARRHLRTWPQLCGNVAIDGLALVINHQRGLPPADRSHLAYRRPEFVDSLDDVTVVTTLQLFDWWRQDNGGAVLTAFGYKSREGIDSGSEPSGATPGAAMWRWWRRRP